MNPGNRVRHIKSGQTGTVRAWALGNVHVQWDNPLSSPPSWVNQFHLEVVR